MASPTKIQIDFDGEARRDIKQLERRIKELNHKLGEILRILTSPIFPFQETSNNDPK